MSNNHFGFRMATKLVRLVNDKKKLIAHGSGNVSFELVKPYTYN